MTWEIDSVWAKSQSIRSEKLCQVNCTDQTATAPWPTSVAQRTSDFGIPHLTITLAALFFFFFACEGQKSMEGCINSTFEPSYSRVKGKPAPFCGLRELERDKQGKSYRNPLPALQSESVWERALTDSAETNSHGRARMSLLPQQRGIIQWGTQKVK